VTGARRLLILCPDPVGERMSGMGIRYTEIARAMAAHGVAVTLAGREVTAIAPPGVRTATWEADRTGGLRALLGAADAVLTPPAAPHVLRKLRRAGVRLAVDLYDPEGLEILERFRTASSPVRALHTTTSVDRLTDALRHGHFFVCASERQRDLWLGAMLALGLLTSAAYDRDQTLRATLDVLPFGVPAEPPSRTAPGVDPIRERFPAIAPEDRVVLWNGGLWGWLDAPAAIRAVARVRAAGVPVRLVFMGASTAGGAAGAVPEARAVIAEEGLEDDVVLFNDEWVRYDARAGWLLSADAAISTHREHLETRFAFRTRLLDCFWAGLPPVVTGGDALADEIAARDLGAVAAPGDVEGLATGIERVLARGREAYAGGLAAAAERHAWPRAVAPLQAFLARTEPPPRLGRVGPLALPPAVQARRAAQRVTRLARALRG
jgi:glycosyltransferase involved in cell wall biosynthesis